MPRLPRRPTAGVANLDSSEPRREIQADSAADYSPKAGRGDPDSCKEAVLKVPR